MNARSYSTFERPQQRQSHHFRQCFSKPTGKSLILVLLWTILIGFINSAVNSTPSFAMSKLYNKGYDLLYIEICLFIVLAVAMTCYPLGGLLADVYFGHYKIIRASLIAMAVSMIVLVIV